MSNPLFGIDIAGIIHQAVSAGLPPGRLTKYTQGSRTAAELSDGTHPTAKQYNFRGILDDFDESEVDGTRVFRSDKKLLIIAGSMPKNIEPEAGDDALIENTTFKVVAIVGRDPAGAHFVVQVR